MIDVAANDPGLVMTVIAAVGLGFCLRRLTPAAREARLRRSTEEASRNYRFELFARLQAERERAEGTAALEIDLTESLDLTDEPLRLDRDDRPDAGPGPDDDLAAAEETGAETEQGPTKS